MGSCILVENRFLMIVVPRATMFDTNVITMDRLMSPSITLVIILEPPPPGLQPIANNPNASSFSSCRAFPKPKAA